MPRYVAFLRAINVGGRVVKMDELRTMFEAMKFGQVETFIASGNVIFETKAEAGAELAAKIEARLLKALGYEVVTFVRTDEEVAEIAVRRPFAAAAMETAPTFCVGLLGAPLGPDGERRLMSLTSADDDFRVVGREVYWLGQKRQSESTFSNAVLEKALGVRTTFRGMSTMQKLAAKYPPQRGES